MKGTYSAEVCPAGQYVISEKCYTCFVGYYCPGVNSLTTGTGAKKCPSGTTSAAGSKSEADCIAEVTTCNSGQYLEGGMCKACPSGTTSDGKAKSKEECKPTVSCNEAGKYYNESSKSCVNCEAGYYCPSGTHVRTKCNSGFTSNAGSDSAEDCNLRVDTSYSPTAGKCGDAHISFDISRFGMKDYTCTSGGKQYYYGLCTKTSQDHITCEMDSSTESCSKGQISENGKCYVNIKFFNGDTLVKQDRCEVPSGSTSCSENIVTPGAQTKEGFEFKGWGNTKDCSSSGTGSNYTLKPSVSKDYYACFATKSSGGSTTTDDNFDISKCKFLATTKVVYTQEYLNCKYVNISYGSARNEYTESNIKSCCQSKGYTYYAPNFTTGYEYCLICGGGSGGGGGGGNNDSSYSSYSSNNNTQNTTQNPKTGNIAIFIVWVIALGTVVYAWIFYKQSRFE